MQTDPFKILLVDDRPENLLSLEEMLTAPHRTFLKAHSGNEALKLTLRNEDIGLIMLDVQMPGMDGFEVASILKSNVRTAEIAIIFVTAISTGEKYTLKGYNEGAVDYLHKPLDINLTRAKVSVFENLFQNRNALQKSVREVKRVNTQLEQFMQIVAHDLKSPLSGMVTILSVLQTDECITGNERANTYVNLLHNSAFQLSDMVNSILEYSRTSADDQKKEAVDVENLLEDVKVILLPPDHISIEAETELPMLCTYKTKLKQVLQTCLATP